MAEYENENRELNNAYGENQGKWRKRPDKGDSGFALWLGNDATPVINKCHNKWLKKKEIMLAIGLCTKAFAAFDHDIGCQAGNGYYK